MKGTAIAALVMGCVAVAVLGAGTVLMVIPTTRKKIVGWVMA